jgi:hypothetical protein
LPARKWVDDTGNYTVFGRLVVIGDDHVRLLKKNGRYCTVPMGRLSQADREYVQTLLVRYGTGTIGQLAVR